MQRQPTEDWSSEQCRQRCKAGSAMHHLHVDPHDSTSAYVHKCQLALCPHRVCFIPSTHTLAVLLLTPSSK